MDFSNILFRCSSLGYIMTEPVGKNNYDRWLDASATLGKTIAEYEAIKNKETITAKKKLAKIDLLTKNLKGLEAIKNKIELSETCKTHLIDVYVSNKYGRNTEFHSKYTDKGNMCEEDSITLYSRVKKRFFKKNEEHLHNEFIKGTPDLYEGKSVFEADIIDDIKTSWDIYTFFRNHAKSLNMIYYWQLQGYMWLSGAGLSRLAYCLVDTPEALIMDEERKLFWRMNAGTTENADYIKACEELRKTMVYDDIPMVDKVIEITIDRNNEDIDRIPKRVQECRIFLNELADRLSPSVLLASNDPEVSAMIIENANTLIS